MHEGLISLHRFIEGDQRRVEVAVPQLLLGELRAQLLEELVPVSALLPGPAPPVAEEVRDLPHDVTHRLLLAEDRYLFVRDPARRAEVDAGVVRKPAAEVGERNPLRR